MKNFFKKFIATIMIIVMLFSFFSFSAFAEDESPVRSAQVKAISVNEGFDSLCRQFTVKKSNCGMKYGYYSPVIDENDAGKYPLIIYVHGRTHGWNDKTFVKSGLTYWASKEIQDLFVEGGAHLLMPKISEFLLSSSQTGSVYKVITEYIENNKDSIDESQIMIMGSCAGAIIVWKLLSQHPERFNAALVIASMKTPSKQDVRNAENIPIWEVSAKLDPIVSYVANQKSAWNTICKTSKVADKCRWSVFSSKAYRPDGSSPAIAHYMAKSIGYNFCYISNNEPYKGFTTVDGSGNNVDLSFDNSIIQWLQSFKVVEEPIEEPIGEPQEQLVA